MINKKLLRGCPVCGCDSGNILHTQKFALPIENPLPKEYNVVGCDYCGFIFADSSATQKEYDAYYEQLSKYEDEHTASGAGIADYDIERLNQTVRAVSRFLPDKSARILDVGAANGGLLIALRSLGYNCLVGLDPSLVCVGKMQFQGLEAKIGGIFSQPHFSERFDCILLTHVLEHIYDVRGAIRNLLPLLKDDGIIYIEVPNAALYEKYFIVPFYFFDCEHINHFDQASIRNLLGGFGGAILEIQDKEIPTPTTRPYPALGVFYKKDGYKGLFRVIPDFTARESVLEHIRQSRAEEGGDRDRRLAKIKSSATPIMVWGAGQYTQRLLAETDLGACNIVAFIDNDSNKQGRKLKGVEIYSKDILKDFEGQIIIASALHGSDISEEMRSMGAQNPILII